MMSKMSIRTEQTLDNSKHTTQQSADDSENKLGRDPILCITKSGRKVTLPEHYKTYIRYGYTICSSSQGDILDFSGKLKSACHAYFNDQNRHYVGYCGKNQNCKRGSKILSSFFSLWKFVTKFRLFSSVHLCRKMCLTSLKKAAISTRTDFIILKKKIHKIVHFRYGHFVYQPHLYISFILFVINFFLCSSH